MGKRVKYMGQASDPRGVLLHWFDVFDDEMYLDGDETLVDRISLWCIEQFGPPEMGVTWSSRAGMFVFGDESFAVAFRMKWC